MSEEQIIEYVKLYPVLYNKTLGQYRDHNMRNIAWEEIAEQLNTPVEEIKEKWARLRNCLTNALKRRRRKSAAIMGPWKFEKQMQFLLPYLDAKTHVTNMSNNTMSLDEDTSATNLIDNTISIDDDIPDTNLSNNITNKEESRDGSESQYSGEATDSSSPLPVQWSAPGVSTSHVVANYNQKYTTKSESDDTLLRDMVDMMKSSHAMKLKRTITDMDEHDHFFLSMSKQLKTLPPRDQAEIKFQIHKLIHESEMKMLKNNNRRSLKF
ncbi:unnamed protein product [Diatraea saccharalis]|uniref:Transcription factor Adf-1 n=1 Tax=Diatraea saccharalis TaxID=40085 RepID=A0A9N9R2U0_9NEOP|nr:unnamed protein product [Diatraea saccharalis]